MSFLPELPAHFDNLARFALLLIAAIALAEIGQRTLRLPRLTGYVLAGLLMGPGVLDWAPMSISGALRPVLLMALGLLLFELGSKVNLRWLQDNPGLLASSLAESGLTFVGAYLFLDAMGYVVATSITVAAIAVSTSPTVVMRVVSENGARGQMTQRLLLFTALNSLYGILLLKIGMSLVHFNQQSEPWLAIGHPVYVTCGSFLLAIVVARAMEWTQAFGLRRESERFSLVIAVLLLASSAGDRLGLSVPMVLLCAGMVMRVQSKRIQLYPEHFGSAGALLVIVLFVLTGVALTPTQILAGGFVSLGLIAIRGTSKLIATGIPFGRHALSPHKSRWLGVALLPMSSLAVLQAYDVSDLYPDFGDDIVAIVLGAVAVMELIAPILTQIALRRAGESSTQLATRSG